MRVQQFPVLLQVAEGLDETCDDEELLLEKVNIPAIQ
jgi:hypothetical protein